MDNFRNFIYWEAASRDTIDFKKTYVDMTDDLLAGLLLSQIIYWHLPNKSGDSKLRIQKKGHFWIAKSHDEWYEEIRFSRRNFDTATKKLVQLALIEKQIFRFNGTPTIHIRLIEENFLRLWTNAIEIMKNKDDKKRPNAAPTLDLYESRKSEETAPTLDLYESHKSICTDRTNGNVRIAQNINIENYKEDLKEKREEEEEYIIDSRPDSVDLFELFEKQNNGKLMLTPIQNQYLKNIQKYKIETSMAYRILKNIDNLNYYSEESLNITFKIMMNKVRGSQAVANPPKWFPETLHSQDFLVKQKQQQQMEIEETNRKYGIGSENRKNPAELADPAGFIIKS